MHTGTVHPVASYIKEKGDNAKCTNYFLHPMSTLIIENMLFIFLRRKSIKTNHFQITRNALFL